MNKQNKLKVKINYTKIYKLVKIYSYSIYSSKLLIKLSSDDLYNYKKKHYMGN